MKKKVGSCVFLVIVLALSSVEPIRPVYGYALDTILMCDDIDTNTQNPIGVGKLYLTDSGYIYCWVNFTDITGPVAITFEWFDPGQNLYRSNIIHTVSGTFPRFSVNNFMKIEGTRAESKTGKWTVKIYVDDEDIGETDFYLADYSINIANIIQLETELVEISIHKDQLISQYASLQVEYDELIKSHENLTYAYSSTLSQERDHNESLRLLISDNEELTESLTQLQSTYDELLNDYNDNNQGFLDIKSELENTRGILLISITIILLFLIIYMSKKVRFARDGF